jgi:hypothetical protein
MTDRPMEQLKASTAVAIAIGPVPQGHVDQSVLDGLSGLLRAEPGVQEAHLVTLRFVGASNLGPAGSDTLAVIVAIHDDPSRVTFDELSRKSASIIAGKLGEGKHLDWMPSNDRLASAARQVGILLHSKSVGR